MTQQVGLKIRWQSTENSLKGRRIYFAGPNGKENEVVRGWEAFAKCGMELKMKQALVSFEA